MKSIPKLRHLPSESKGMPARNNFYFTTGFVERLENLERSNKLLAAEIHREIFPALVSVKLYLEINSVREKKFASKDLRLYKTILDAASEKLRAVYSKLYPSILTKLGLIGALESLIDGQSEDEKPSLNVLGKIEDHKFCEAKALNVYYICETMIRSLPKYNKGKLTINIHLAENSLCVDFLPGRILSLNNYTILFHNIATYLITLGAKVERDKQCLEIRIKIPLKVLKPKNNAKRN